MLAWSLWLCVSCAAPMPHALEHVPRSITVRAFWDGGTAERVAEQLAVPLERELAQIKGVVRTITTCDAESCVIRLQHDPAIPSHKVAFDANAKIKQIQNKLPDGAKAAAYAADLGLFPDLVLALVLDAEDAKPEHHDAASEFAHMVMQLPDTVRFELPGAPRRDTLVEIDPDRAKACGIDAAELAAAIEQRILRVDDYHRVIVGEHPGERGDVADIVVKKVGTTAIRVKDVARVRAVFVPGAVHRVNQKPAVLLHLFLREGVSAADVSACLRRIHALVRPPEIVQVIAVFARRRSL